MDNDKFLKQLTADFDDLDDLTDLEESVMSSSNGGSDTLPLHEVYTNGTVDSLEADDTVDSLEALDDLDAEFGSGNDSKKPESEIPEELSGIAASISFDMVDLTQDVPDTETVEETSEDKEQAALALKVQTQLVPECTKRGFEIDDPTNVELVAATCRYIAGIENATENQAQLYQIDYSSMIGSLVSADAMYVNQQESIQQYKSSILKSVNDDNLKDASAEAINRISQEILNIVTFNTSGEDITFDNIKPSDISVNKIYTEIINSDKFNKAYIMSHESQMRNFISSTISIILTNYRNNITRSKQDTARRESVSRILTNEIYDVIDDLKDKPHAYIKRIDAVNGGNLVCTCASCNAKTKVKSLMKFIFYQNSNTIIHNGYPSQNICSGCGSILLFPEALYKVACDYYVKNNAVLIRQDLNRSQVFGSGVSIITRTPSIEQLPLQITCIVHDSNAMAIESKVVNMEIFDSEEWLNAVNAFYNKVDLLHSRSFAKASNITKSANNNAIEPVASIKSFNGISLGVLELPVGRYSYDTKFLAVIAASVAQIAGVDYNLTKGKAFVSLINYFCGSDILRNAATTDKMFSLMAAYNLATSFATADEKCDLNKLETEVLDNLKIIACSIDKNYSVGEDKNELRVFFRKHSDTLEQMIAETVEDNLEFVQLLSVSKYALSMLPIIDYTQTSVYSIVQLISNETIFNLINEICDRMIINHYSEQFFDYWCRLSFQHVATLQSRLKASADTESIEKAMNLLFKDVLAPEGVYNSECFFPNATVESMDAWDTLRRLTDFANTGNYYKFCKEALKLQKVQYGFSKKFDLAMEEFYAKNYATFENVATVSEAMFFLSDMFTTEEIEAGADDVAYLVFGRYIPYRLNGESLHDYAIRFKDSADVNCKDNMELFRNIKDLPLVYFGAAITHTSFENFRVASFMSGLVDSVINSNNVKSLALLGISELNYSITVKNLNYWKFANFDNNNMDVMSLISGYYFTDANDAVFEVISKMLQTFFQASSKVIPLKDIFDFDSELMSMLDRIASNPDNSDKGSMINELFAWELTKGFCGRFAGE